MTFYSDRGCSLTKKAGGSVSERMPSRTGETVLQR